MTRVTGKNGTQETGVSNERAGAGTLAKAGFGGAGAGQELVPRQRLLQLRLWLVLRQGVLQLGL